MRSITLCLLIAFAPFASNAQDLMADLEGSLVKWMSLPEALEKTKNQPRPIILDFYTDWCGWCKKMMKSTYANPSLAQYINTNFYPVKFNAESKDTIEYLGIKYGPSSDAPKATHNLAIKLLQGKLVYPTTLFLNNYDKTKNEFSFSMLAQGYLDIQKIEPMLVYELENVFRTSAFEDFQDQYQKSFYDSAFAEKLKELVWLKPTDFFGKTDSSSKKTLVLIHTEWCNACRVMRRTSFLGSGNPKALQEKFNLVELNPEMPEQISFKGQLFTNPRSAQMPFHQLAVALCRNNLVLPTLAILDEKLNLLDAVPFYLSRKVVDDLSTYYGDNLYKTKTWADFVNPPVKAEKIEKKF